MSLLTKTLIGASIPFLLVVLYVISEEQPRPAVIPALDIGIEHTKQLKLSMTVTKNDLMRMVDVSNDKVEPIALSVPEHWVRGEVRNVPLSKVTSEAPSFGYVRWHLPPNASVSFRSDKSFNQLNLHNPSGVLVNIRFTAVDLVQNTGEHNVYRLKDGSVKVP